MTAKEIHDNLLSLFIRGLGVWMLYEAVPRVYGIADDFRSVLAPPNNTWTANWWDLFYLFVNVLAAAYFILGAPPFLKWATCGKPPNE